MYVLLLLAAPWHCKKSKPHLPLAEELVNLHEGQGLDIYWRDHCACPTEEEYRAMVIHSFVLASFPFVHFCVVPKKCPAWHNKIRVYGLLCTYRDWWAVPTGGPSDASLQRVQKVYCCHSPPPSSPVPVSDCLTRLFMCLLCGGMCVCGGSGDKATSFHWSTNWDSFSRSWTTT